MEHSVYCTSPGAWRYGRAAVLAVGTGEGGLDTGSVANSTWYHVFLIMRLDTGVVDALFSTSATAPTMPANYGYKRRIGSVLTNGSANIIAFSQVGEQFLWMVPVLDVNTTIGTSRSLLTLSVPLGVKTRPILGWLNASKGGATPLSYVCAPDITDSAVTSPYISIYPLGTGGNAVSMIQGDILRTNTSSQIAMRSDTASTSCFIITAGWIDPRGKDS